MGNSIQEFPSLNDKLCVGKGLYPLVMTKVYSFYRNKCLPLLMLITCRYVLGARRSISMSSTPVTKFTQTVEVYLWLRESAFLQNKFLPTPYLNTKTRQKFSIFFNISFSNDTPLNSFRVSANKIGSI